MFYPCNSDMPGDSAKSQTSENSEVRGQETGQRAVRLYFGQSKTLQNTEEEKHRLGRLDGKNPPAVLVTRV